MKLKILLLVNVSLLYSCGPGVRKTSLPVATQTMQGRHEHEHNVILIIGDGMGLEEISALSYDLDTVSAFERFPVTGLHKSYSSDDLITDSAAGATAFACGIKTRNGYVGVDSTGKARESILEEACRKGLSTGIVVTSTIVHATPAAFVSHVTNRDAYEAIAADLLDSGCDVFFGGGQKYFTRRNTDSLNLEKELEKKGYAVTDYFESDLSSYNWENLKKLVYFTADGDPLTAAAGRDYLAPVSVRTMDFLHRKKTGFFAMIEGSQIDWGGHANNLGYVLTEMKDFNRLLHAVLDWAKREGNTTVVVTADHETGGLSILQGSKRGDLKVNFSTTKHTGVFIPVFAFGPGADLFKGVYENTAIYEKMRKILFN